jgi:hypothetical protein
MIFAPSAAKRLAIVRPNPAVAPVTRMIIHNAPFSFMKGIIQRR